jgi:hypothetical protein
MVDQCKYSKSIIAEDLIQTINILVIRDWNFVVLNYFTSCTKHDNFGFIDRIRKAWDILLHGQTSISCNFEMTPENAKEMAKYIVEASEVVQQVIDDESNAVNEELMKKLETYKSKMRPDAKFLTCEEIKDYVNKLTESPSELQKLQTALRYKN